MSICSRNNLYLNLTVMSLCVVSADIWGLGPQQPGTMGFDKRRHCSGPERSFVFLPCEPSVEVYQE